MLLAVNVKEQVTGFTALVNYEQMVIQGIA